MAEVHLLVHQRRTGRPSRGFLLSLPNPLCMLTPRRLLLAYADGQVTSTLLCRSFHKVTLYPPFPLEQGDKSDFFIRLLAIPPP